MNLLHIKYITGENRQSGGTLIAIIVAMVIIAVLVAAVYTLNTTALFNQVAAQRATKAFYLSESGIRVASSEFRAAVAAGANTVHQKLPALHEKKFDMPDNGGSFTVYVYPYWLYYYNSDPDATIPAGTSSITLYLPGALPRADDTDTPITFPTSGLLRIKDVRSTTTTTWSGITYVSYSGATSGTFNPTYGTPVTLNSLTRPDSGSGFEDNIVVGDEFYIGYTVETDSTLSLSGTRTDLTLTMPTSSGTDSTNMAKYFPPHGGTLFVPGNVTAKAFKYDLRIITTAGTTITVKLTNIRKLDGTTPAEGEIPKTGNQVYIGKSVDFQSTSTYGGE